MRLALTAVAALSLCAAACGGVESEATQDEPSTTEALGRPAATSSFRMEWTEGRTSWEGERRELRCDGAVDTTRARIQVSCERLDEAGGYEIVGIGTTTYLKPGGEEQFTKSEGDDPSSLSSPAKLFATLRAASTNTRRLGRELVRGEPTQRYSMTVPCERANVAECRAKTVVVILWVDADRVIRRARIRQPGYVYTAEFYDFGAALDIEPPPADQVVAPGQDPAREDCPFDLDAGSPISVRLALDTLRAQELRIWLRENCHGTTVSDITGWVGPSSGEGAGELNCSLFEAPPVGVSSSRVTGSTSPRGSDVGPDETRRLANLECSVAVIGAPDREAVDRLSAAFEELRREINP